MLDHWPGWRSFLLAGLIFSLPIIIAIILVVRAELGLEAFIGWALTAFALAVVIVIIREIASFRQYPRHKLKKRYL